VTAALTSNETVKDHCAALRETWSPVATAGMSGAPRLLMTATTIPTNTKPGIRNRLVVLCAGWFLLTFMR
jgi:hypothetical protein